MRNYLLCWCLACSSLIVPATALGQKDTPPDKEVDTKLGSHQPGHLTKGAKPGVALRPGQGNRPESIQPGNRPESNRPGNMRANQPGNRPELNQPGNRPANQNRPTPLAQPGGRREMHPSPPSPPSQGMESPRPEARPKPQAQALKKAETKVKKESKKDE